MTQIHQDTITWISSIIKPETFLVCKRCNNICALIRERPDDRLLLRISCLCGTTFILPDNVPSSLHATLLDLTPLKLAVALNRSYNGAYISGSHAASKRVKYLQFMKD